MLQTNAIKEIHNNWKKNALNCSGLKIDSVAKNKKNCSETDLTFRALRKKNDWRKSKN